jgi:hypothetical protein
MGNNMNNNMFGGLPFNPFMPTLNLPYNNTQFNFKQKEDSLSQPQNTVN